MSEQDDIPTQPDMRTPLEEIRDDMTTIRIAAERAANAAIETLQCVHELRGKVQVIENRVSSVEAKVVELAERVEILEASS